MASSDRVASDIGERDVLVVVRKHSHPERPIKRPVLNGFADVFRRDRVGSSEVGDGPGDFQDAVVGTGAQV